MFTRLNLIRRGCSFSSLIAMKYRPIHLTSSWATIKTDQIPATKKEPVTTSTRSASEITELVLTRLHLREQRGIMKALIVGSGVVLISAVLFLYVFRKPLKNQTVAQVADVARSSLEQDSVRQQVNVLSQELIQNLLSDPNILSKALVFLEHLMDDPATKQTLIRLLQRLMTDREMQKNVSEFASQIIYDVMNKAETEIQLGQLFRRAILQKDNQDTLYLLLKDFIDSEKTKQLLTNLAHEVTQNVLNDETVKITATNFVKNILNDSGLQEQSGDFAWNAVKKALKPKWFTSRAESTSSTVHEQQTQSDDVKIPSDFENIIVLPPLTRSS